VAVVGELGACRDEGRTPAADRLYPHNQGVVMAEAPQARAASPWSGCQKPKTLHGDRLDELVPLGASATLAEPGQPRQRNSQRDSTRATRRSAWASSASTSAPWITACKAGASSSMMAVNLAVLIGTSVVWASASTKICV
jgi:hypothetical protein